MAFIKKKKYGLNTKKKTATNTKIKPTKKKARKKMPSTTTGGNRTETLEKVVISDPRGVFDILRKNGEYEVYVSEGEGDPVEVITCRSLVFIPGHRIEIAGRAYDDNRSAHARRELDKAEWEGPEIEE